MKKVFFVKNMFFTTGDPLQDLDLGEEAFDCILSNGESH